MTDPWEPFNEINYKGIGIIILVFLVLWLVFGFFWAIVISYFGGLVLKAG